MRTLSILFLSAWLAPWTACNGELGKTPTPILDGGLTDDATTDGLSPPDGQVCDCAGACCAAGEVCYGDRCVQPGGSCALHSDCPYGEFCDPVLQRCLPKEAAFCQYKPPVGKLTPAIEWTWSTPTAEAQHFDVLAPPVVIQLTDDNKDGKLGRGDIPDLVFVSYEDVDNHPVSIYRDGILRAVSGDSGKEIWSVTDPSLRLIAGASVAAGDLDGDGLPEIVAVDASFHVRAFDHNGKPLWTSSAKVGANEASTKPWAGWGGGISIADLDADGKPEVFLDATVFDNTGALLWKKKDGGCGAPTCNFGPLSTAANLDGDAKGTLELIVGNRVYTHDGKLIWQYAKAGDGYPAVADFFGDGDPDVVLVASGKVYIIDGKSGTLEWGPVSFPYPAGGVAAKAGPGGPPTVADFDGDGHPEIGVAGGYYYVVFDPDCKQGGNPADCPSGTTNGILWKKASKDLSSRATGSSVFDFEGDGKAEVIYSDECFLRVYDGSTGKVLFTWSNNTRTATEAPLVADVDGDGRAEIVMVSNRRVWQCDTTYPSWVKPPGYVKSGDVGYHGITVLGDKNDNWVGTRRIWNQHAYHVSNVCDGIDQACVSAQNSYGHLPNPQRDNWSVPWLNNFRQNVQGLDVFNAPDLVTTGVQLSGACSKEHTSVVFTVTNKGSAVVAPGLKVTLYYGDPAGGGPALATTATTTTLNPGESETLTVQIKLPSSYTGEKFELYVVADDVGDGTGERNECVETNNVGTTAVQCVGPS